MACAPIKGPEEPMVGDAAYLAPIVSIVVPFWLAKCYIKPVNQNKELHWRHMETIGVHKRDTGYHVKLGGVGRSYCESWLKAS